MAQPSARQIPSKLSTVPVNGKDHSADQLQPAAGSSDVVDFISPADHQDTAQATVAAAHQPAAAVDAGKKPHPKPERKPAASERAFSERADGEDFFDYVAGFPLQDWEKDYLAIYKLTPNRRLVEKVNGPVDEDWLEQNIVPKFGGGVYQIQLRAMSGKHKNDFIKLELGDIRDLNTTGNSAPGTHDAGNPNRGMGRNERPTLEGGFAAVMKDVSAAHLEASKQNLSLMRESVGSGNPIALVKEVMALARGNGESESLVATLIKMQSENALALAKLQAENSQALAKMQADFTEKRLEADRQHRAELKELLEKKEEGKNPLSFIEQVGGALDAIDGIRDRVGGGSADVQQKGWLGFAQTAMQSPVLGQLMSAFATAAAQKTSSSTLPAIPAGTPAAGREAAAVATSAAQPSPAAPSPFPFPVQSIIELVTRLQGAVYREDFDNAGYYADMIDIEYQPIAGWIRQTDAAQIVAMIQGDPRGAALFATEQSQKFVAEILEELKTPATPAGKKAAGKKS